MIQIKPDSDQRIGGVLPRFFRPGQSLAAGAGIDHAFVAFGLLHGFTFAAGLREQFQFAGSHLLTSLLAFNLGIELVQLLVLLIAIPLLDRLFGHAATERLGIIIVSALVAHTAWHWLGERGEQLAKFPLPHLTTFGAADWASLLRWLIALLVLAALAWMAAALVRNRQRRMTAPESAAASGVASSAAPGAASGGAPL